MKNLASILLLYNLISIQLLYTKWIYKVVYFDLGVFGKYKTHWYNVIDTIDIPFYFIVGFIFFKWLWRMLWRKDYKYLNSFQTYTVLGCLIFVLMKFINNLCECITLPNIIFWGRFIVVFTFFAYVVTKINFDKFKK